MGLSENRVPLKLMIHHYFLYQNDNLGIFHSIPDFQTHANGLFSIAARPPLVGSQVSYNPQDIAKPPTPSPISCSYWSYVRQLG